MLSRSRSLASWLATLPARLALTTTVRRRILVAGAISGLSLGVAARVWMRTISDDHVFSVGGTLFIVLFFGGMGALVGLTLWWRRRPERRPRMLIFRAVGVAPFALLGPFMLLFLPGFLVALATGHRSWRTRWRRRAFVAAVLFFALTELILLTADVPGSGAVRLASGLLYLPLAYALFISNRLALDPLPVRQPLALPQG
ncbi:MAG: hypothetical protein WBO97_14780 [Tepidiformaceae bacterium]